MKPKPICLKGCSFYEIKKGETYCSGMEIVNPEFLDNARVRTECMAYYEFVYALLS